MSQDADEIRENMVVAKVHMKQAGVQVTFQVTQDGQPLAGARIAVTQAGRPVGEAQPAGAGKYAIQLPPGDYSARVTKGRLGTNQSFTVPSGGSITVGVQFGGGRDGMPTR
mgnify:CR=1 FL=1